MELSAISLSVIERIKRQVVLTEANMHFFHKHRSNPVSLSETSPLFIEKPPGFFSTFTYQPLFLTLFCVGQWGKAVFFFLNILQKDTEQSNYHVQKGFLICLKYKETIQDSIKWKIFRECRFCMWLNYITKNTIQMVDIRLHKDMLDHLAELLKVSFEGSSDTR